MVSNVQTLQLGGKKFVVIELEEFDRLRAAASDAAGPPLPTPNAQGRTPAIEYARASLARKLITGRRKAGWTVEQLAKKAKVRVEVIEKLERGDSSPNVAAVDRIDRALKSAKA